jgi:hypothetical protein
VVIVVCLSALAVVSTPRLATAPVLRFGSRPPCRCREPQVPAEKKAKSDKNEKKPPRK